MEWKRTLWRVGIFAGIGLLMEVGFTATLDLIWGDWNMFGFVSLWMLSVYGWMGVLIAPVAGCFKRAGISLPLRAVLYMILIFAVEYVYGVIFTAAGLRIWDYSHLPYNLHGHITVVWTPLWYVLGLLLEALHVRVDACAALLARGAWKNDGAKTG